MCIVTGQVDPVQLVYAGQCFHIGPDWNFSKGDRQAVSSGLQASRNALITDGLSGAKRLIDVLLNFNRLL